MSDEANEQLIHFSLIYFDFIDVQPGSDEQITSRCVTRLRADFHFGQVCWTRISGVSAGTTLLHNA